MPRFVMFRPFAVPNVATYLDSLASRYGPDAHVDAFTGLANAFSNQGVVVLIPDRNWTAGLPGGLPAATPAILRDQYNAASEFINRFVSLARLEEYNSGRSYVDEHTRIQTYFDRGGEYRRNSFITWRAPLGDRLCRGFYIPQNWVNVGVRGYRQSLSETNAWLRGLDPSVFTRAALKTLGLFSSLANGLSAFETNMGNDLRGPADIVSSERILVTNAAYRSGSIVRTTLPMQEFADIMRMIYSSYNVVKIMHARLTSDLRKAKTETVESFIKRAVPLLRGIIPSLSEERARIIVKNNMLGV